MSVPNFYGFLPFVLKVNTSNTISILKNSQNRDHRGLFDVPFFIAKF